MRNKSLFTFFTIDVKNVNDVCVEQAQADRTFITGRKNNREKNCLVRAPIAPGIDDYGECLIAGG